MGSIFSGIPKMMVMILHLGMSGRVLITKDLPKVKDAHDHLIFKTEDGFFIRYNDPIWFRRHSSVEKLANIDH